MELPKENRLFVGLDLSRDGRAALAGLGERLVATRGGRAVPAANLHVTLAFLGRVDPSRASALASALADALASAPVASRAESLAARPGERRARLLALTLSDDRGLLASLMLRTRAAAAHALGQPNAGAGPTWPHVTLVRFRPPTSLERSPLPDPRTSGELVFDFGRASLYNSESQRVGPPRYRALATFPLE